MKKLIFAIFVLGLTACSSSTQISKPVIAKLAAQMPDYSLIKVDKNGTEAPDHFLAAVESYLKQQLQAVSKFSEESLYVVEIEVQEYRMRSGFTRAMFGVFAGKDGIDSKVIIKNKDTGEVVGESVVSSFNVMAIGNMEDVARMHAEEISKYLTNNS